MDKLSDWVNVVFFVALGMTLATSFAAVVLSHRRVVALQAELEKVRAESVRLVAAAEERANMRPPVNVVTADSLAREQLTKENQELSIQLEKEKRLRLEAEERTASPAVSAVPFVPAQTDNGSRRLSSGQEHTLLLRLKRFEGARASLIELMNPEARPLARQIAAALSKANWNVTVRRVGSLTPSQFGIICTHGTSDEAASALVDTLRSFKLTVYERTGVGPLEILVGLKPL